MIETVSYLLKIEFLELVCQVLFVPRIMILAHPGTVSLVESDIVTN